MKPLLRVAAVVSSLGLLIGCVWLAHTEANPQAMPGSKSFAIRITTGASKPLRRTMPGPNNGVILAPGKTTAAIGPR